MVVGVNSLQHSVLLVAIYGGSTPSTSALLVRRDLDFRCTGQMQVTKPVHVCTGSSVHRALDKYVQAADPFDHLTA